MLYYEVLGAIFCENNIKDCKKGFVLPCLGGGPAKSILVY